MNIKESIRGFIDWRKGIRDPYPDLPYMNASDLSAFAHLVKSDPKPEKRTYLERRHK